MMSTRLNLSNEAEQWLANLINNLAEIYRRFDTMYHKALLPLLASFTEICGDIWRIDLIPSLVYSYDYHYYFKCGEEQYFRVPVEYRMHEKIYSEAGKNPIATYLLNKVKETITEETKRRRRLRAMRFKLQLDADLLVYHDYAFPIGKIRDHHYDLCRIYIMESMYGVPIIEFSDECTEDEYTYEISISLTNEGLELVWYKNIEDPNLPPTYLLNALYKKKDEIDKRIDPILKTLDKVIKGAVSLLLY